MRILKLYFTDGSYLFFSKHQLPDNSGGIAKEFINKVIEFKREQNIPLVVAINTVINKYMNRVVNIVFAKMS
jgi:hypothetical protein